MPPIIKSGSRVKWELTAHIPFSNPLQSLEFFRRRAPPSTLLPPCGECPVCTHTHTCTATSCCCPRWWVWDSSFDAGESLSPSGLPLAPSWLWTAPVSSIHSPPRAAVWMEKIISLAHKSVYGLSAWMLCLKDNCYCIIDVKGVNFLSFYFLSEVNL